MAQQRDDEDLGALIDLVAALGEHIVDLERRIAAIETGASAPKRIAASELRRVTKALMVVSLRWRRRGRDEATVEAKQPHEDDHRG